MLSDEFVKVLDALCAKLGLVVDWTAVNVVPYVEELFTKYISYEITLSVYYISIWLVITLMFLFVWRCSDAASMRHINDSSHVTHCIAELSCMALFLCGIVSVIVIGVQIRKIISCLMLPEKQFFDLLRTYYY